MGAIRCRLVIELSLQSVFNMLNHPSLLINGRFVTQRRTGVQNFAHNLCLELRRAGVRFSLVVPKNAKVLYPVEVTDLLHYGQLQGHLWEQFELPALVKKRSAILLNLCNTGPMCLTAQITVLHDLAFLENPNWFHPIFAKWYAYMVPRMAHKCKSLITVSQQVKSEIVERLGIDAGKISVIGNKVDESLMEVAPERPVNLPGDFTDFYLMVGSQDPRKNFGPACKALSQDTSKKVLVIGGSGPFRATATYTSLNVVHLGPVSPGQLKWAFLNAKALVTPSLYEGFGIPNLEAMALGCPIIVSDIPAFREVCQSAAWYFNPNEPSSLVEAIRTFESVSADNDHRIQEGKTIFTRYQSENRANIIKEICDTV